MHPCDNTETLLRVLREPRRNSYFYGKRMDVQHFQMEQDYGKLKQWLINRLTVGKGVICGLNVSVDGGRICVGPGVAIDGLGREIIVPRGDCIDPITQEGGCCGPGGDEHAIPRESPHATDAPRGDLASLRTAVTQPEARLAAAQPSATMRPGSPPNDASGIFTLSVCYRECKTDYQPVLASDCGTREQCAAGTIVESYCLKVAPGFPPLQPDPEWCAKLWPTEKAKAQPQPPPDSRPSHFTPSTELVEATEFERPDFSSLIGAAAAPIAGVATHDHPNTHAAVPTSAQANEAFASRRHLLCDLFSGTCEPPESDPCVPLAVMLLRNNRIEHFEVCSVRPRIYSNAVLFDLILCLADKIEECCDQKGTNLLRVKSVEFLGGSSHQNVIATVQSPLGETPVPIASQGNSIRIKFTQPFDQGANVPTTPGRNDANFKRHNVLVLPEGARRDPYAPGTLAIESPDTIRWDLSKDTPFWSGQHDGWEKGRLRLVIFGDADTASSRFAISDTGGKALDGEPIVPESAALSGNGTPGGTFSCVFRIS